MRSSTDAADHEQERLRLRRLPPAQGRHARQPLDLRPHPGADRQPDRQDQGASAWCSAISGTASSTADHSAVDRRHAGSVFRVADSQVASRWGNILEFQGFDLITPNEREARFALGDQDTCPAAGAEALRAGNCRDLILKLGERGLITYRSARTSRTCARSSRSTAS